MSEPLKGTQGFGEIHYKGKPLRGFTGTMRTIIMQKNNPDRLDMRYRTNRGFVAEQTKFREQHRVHAVLGL